ncbi:hypothetical protein LOZ65_006839 [Ophidiomyces ophidiicola]|nr:hypothetical protein LOZ65_006839 [Ophidiomyces ophidiicola]
MPAWLSRCLSYVGLAHCLPLDTNKPLPPIPPPATKNVTPGSSVNLPTAECAAALMECKASELKIPKQWHGYYVVHNGQEIRNIEQYRGIMYGTNMGGVPWVVSLARTAFSKNMIPILCRFKVYDEAKGGKVKGGEDWSQNRNKWPLEMMYSTPYLPLQMPVPRDSPFYSPSQDSWASGF